MTGDLDERALLAQLLARDGFAVPQTGDNGALTRRPPTHDGRAGAPQRRFWVQDRLEGHSDANTLGCLAHLSRPVTEAALSAAVQTLFARHEALRTRFCEGPDGTVLEHADLAEPPASGLIDASPDDLFPGDRFEFPGERFDMACGPLWRLYRFSDPAAADVVLLVCHHAILDLAGARCLLTELDAMVRGAGLPPAPLQQADHAWWRATRDAARERAKEHWRERLAGHPPDLRLPAATSTPESAGPPLITPLALDAGLSDAIQRFAVARGATPFFVILAAWAAALGRFAAAEDVSIGTAVDNRATAGAEGIVGCLSDLIVLRCDLSHDTGLGALTDHLRQTCGADLEHTALGFAEIVDLIAPQRLAGVAPLFQALFNLLPLAAVALRPLPCPAARADLALELEDDGCRFTGRLETRRGLIPPTIAAALAEALVTVLRDGIARPDRPLSRLPLMSPATAEALVARTNPAFPASDGATLVDLLEDRARRSPHAVALIEGRRAVTVAEVEDDSRRLAEVLISQGLAPGAPVAVCLERSADLVSAALAVMRAGGAALLLNPAHPPPRLNAILANSGARLMIAGQRPGWLAADAPCAVLSPTLQSTASTPLPLPRPGPDDAAYVVYTSGSTGQPKGVIGRHRGMVNRLRRMAERFPFATDDVACLKTSAAFVDFIAEALGPLLAGVPAVIADDATAQDPHGLTALIAEAGVTRIVLVPSLLRAWLDMVPDLGWRLASLRLCVTSGEAMPAALAARFRAAVPGCRLVNLYGSSEISADATWHAIEDGEHDPVPIGIPIPGNHIAVVDRDGRAVPPGVPGEIAVAGIGVAAGYLGDTDLTARRFRADLPAFAGLDASVRRAFLTGDCGLWDDRDRLIYLGRLDRQVKVQGVRVEPAEIEVAIEAHPAVSACHIADLRRPGGQTALAAYVVGHAPAAELRRFLTGRLPAALVPSFFVALDALPLGPSGKIDRFALPAPDAQPDDGATPGPRRALTPLEALVAAVWSGILGGSSDLEPDRDFFRAGGGSLQAIVAATRLSEALGRPVPPVLLFETPTLAAFARRLEDEDGEGPLPPPRPVTSASDAPATSNQVWLWQEYRDAPARTAYNLSVAYRLDGPLDRAALDAALCALMRRHHALRTCLRPGADDALSQVVIEAPATVLRRVEEAEGAHRPFALDREPPFRAELVACGPDRHDLVLTVHHVASDGWAGRRLVEDLAALYRPGQTSPGRGVPDLAPPLLQLADIGHWQRAIRPLLAQRLDAYRDSLAGAGAPYLAGVRADRPLGGPAAVVPVPVTGATLAQLEALGRSLHASRFVMMLAAWSLLLSRWADTPRPLIGFPQAGRNVPGLESVVGFLANTVLMTSDLEDAADFTAVVAAVRHGLLRALRFQDIPLAWLQATGHGWPADTASPAVRTLVVVEDTTDWTLRLDGLDCTPLSRPDSPQARVDLALLVSDTADGTDIRVEYAADRIPAALAHRLADGLACLIEAAVADPATLPGRLPLMNEDPHGGVVSAPPAPAPVAERLDALLDAAVAADPDAPAADSLDGPPLSRAHLRAHAAQIAARLIAAGVAPGDRVALAAPPSPRQLAGLLGIWRAGATAVSLDPAHPADRLHWTLEDAEATAVLVDLDSPPTLDGLPHIALGTLHGTLTDLPPRGGDAPAALVYTSGTTGQPKGVPVAHAALCRLGAALADAYGVRAGDRALQVVSPAFDVALSDVALALAGGAVLVVPPRAAVLPGRSLAATLERGAVTHMQAPASILAATVPGPLPALRAVAVGGEVCPPDDARRWAEGRRLFVAYGPTEATVTVALAPLDPAAASLNVAPLGRPFCGATLAVVDEAGQPLPVGVPGELVIGGPGVAAGYYRRPDLTAARFVADRYHTGDRARREEDGSFSFLGRLDRQIKLRGFRIEPGEIEAALASQPGVTRALVALRPLGLVAWAVAEPDVAPDTLRQALRRILPEHMVPAAIAVITEVPLTANGKIDWDTLPTPSATSKASPPDGSPNLLPDLNDEAAVRRWLAALWAELLPDRPRIGLDQSFFDIGGHSLLVVRLQERIEDAFTLTVPVGEMFANPTVRTQAAMLHARRPPSPPAAPEFEEFVL